MAKMSPPSRGAWIEITKPLCFPVPTRSRPPRGGRGLKFQRKRQASKYLQSPPSRGAWIEMSV